MIINSATSIATAPLTRVAAPSISAPDTFHGSDGRQEALAVLETAGRPQPEADLGWLVQRFGKSNDLGDLARFYVLAQSKYTPDNKDRNSLIEESTLGGDRA